MCLNEQSDVYERLGQDDICVTGSAVTPQTRDPLQALRVVRFRREKDFDEGQGKTVV